MGSQKPTSQLFCYCITYKCFNNINHNLSGVKKKTTPKTLIS